MRLASLAMYASPEQMARANQALWHYLAHHLRAAGLPDVPEELDASVAYNEAWLRPDLLLAQTCGFPFIKHLAGQVRIVATPTYAYPGCEGPRACSFIVVAAGSSARSLADLAGLRVAINEPDSNSGSNLLRAAIAPLAREGRFFGSVIETGGHRASMEAVAEGRADVASIDCVTYGNTLRFDPGFVARLRILARTPSGPGLPLITRREASDAEIEILRSVLQSALAEPDLAVARDTLGLTGFAILNESDYAELAELERVAVALGYPAIA